MGGLVNGFARLFGLVRVLPVRCEWCPGGGPDDYSKPCPICNDGRPYWTRKAKGEA